MHKRTFNIAALCLATLLVVFIVTKKTSDTNESGNIIAEGGGERYVPQNNTDEYQQQILQAIIDQNIKAFENVSESFKRKPTDTLSETIAKNTFAQYLNYNTTDNLDIDKITSETMAALKEHPVQKSNVSVQNIIMAGSNDVVALRTYVNQISIIQLELAKGIYKVSKKPDASAYIKNLYRTTSNLYKRVPVPQSLLKEHLGIINGYADYATGFELLELQNADPARALSGIQTAKDAQDMLVQSFGSVKKIVLLNNITYTEKEPAYAWFINATGTEAIKLN